tara:strand:+ start:8165 stop:8635 length:471 start_codon:yes stop_codon:yes gene_type:complete
MAITLTFENQEPNISLQPGDLAYYVKNLNNNYEGQYIASGDAVVDGQYEDEFEEDMPAGVSTMILIGQVWAITFDYEPDDIEATPDETLQKMLVHIYTPTSGIIPPAVNDFIFFTKDTSVEKSNVKGYYSRVVMQNDSKDKAELYAVSCETTRSSK